MYGAFADRYCYPGTDILRNRLGIREADRLEAFEAEISAQRAEEPLPHGRLSGAHFRAIHRHLFQDVYPWAGRVRTVRIARGNSMFCYPEHIPDQLRQLFGWLKARAHLRDLDEQAFAVSAAHFLSELNVIHAFRDGNGRAQLTFLALVAARAGHPLNLARLDPEGFLDAMIAGFNGDETPLSEALFNLL